MGNPWNLEGAERYLWYDSIACVLPVNRGIIVLDPKTVVYQRAQTISPLASRNPVRHPTAKR